MAEIKKKLEILTDVDKPVEEITECIIAISIMHGPSQLEILKEVELWLGKTITEAEQRINPNKESDEQESN